MLSTLFAAESSVVQIGVKSDAEWTKMISDFKKKNIFVEAANASAIGSNFKNYKNKYMIFPKFAFTEFVTDEKGQKYFYSGDSGTWNIYVVKHNSEIQEKFIKYSYILGGLADEKWEVIGEIKQVYGWWHDVVEMDIVAMRIPGKACAIVKNGTITFIGEDLIDKELASKSKDPYADIPKNLTALPKSLDPLKTAKLCFYLSSVEKNYDLWLQLLSKEECFYRGEPQAKVDSWWKLLTSGRSYFFVRVNKDNEKEKQYYFQIQKDGENLGNPKPIYVIKENGEWRVSGINP
jgi:hypothetical protein